MCNLSKGVEEKGIAKGMKIGLEIAEAIKVSLEKGTAVGISIEKGIVEEIAERAGVEKGMVEKVVKETVEEINIGMENALLFSARNMVQKMGISVEQAMAVLDIPDSDRPKFLEQLA